MAATARIDDLQALEAAIWTQLAHAIGHRGHEWRVGVLATVDRGAADARCVVLRDLRADERTLLFYTDERSPKVRQIEACPQGTLVLWSRTLGWQLRLRVDMTFETSGPDISSRWARMRTTPSAQDYLSPLPPGSPLAHPASERGTRGFFTVVTARVRAMDWLELHADGHRRAGFDDRGARWLVP